MTQDPDLDQLQLPLEWTTYDHYTVKLAKGAVGDMEVVRTHVANTEDDALNLVEALRDQTKGRDFVTWQADEVDERGLLFGLAPGGVVFEISVIPPFSQGLS